MEQISLCTATKSLCSQKGKKKKSVSKEAVQIVVDAQTLVLAFSTIMAAAVTGPAGCSRSPVIERSGCGRHGGLRGSWEEARPSVRLQGRHHWDGQADTRLEKALSTCCGARRPFCWWYCLSYPRRVGSPFKEGYSFHCTPEEFYLGYNRGPCKPALSLSLPLIPSHLMIRLWRTPSRLEFCKMVEAYIRLPLNTSKMKGVCANNQELK